MLNICIPMAGKGSRFLQAGYKDPKPFINVDGLPMVQRVVENLTPYQPYRLIFVARREHEDYIKKHMSFATHVVYVDEVTEGAACTVLLAEEHLEPGELVIANSDQLVQWNDATKTVTDEECGAFWKESNNIQDFINDCEIRGADASIATFPATHPKWSYAKIDKGGWVTEVAEKRVISNIATVGVYYFSDTGYFLNSAKDMIRKDIRVNGEFYVCPVFNELINTFHRSVVTYNVHGMWGLGTPEDLNAYLTRSSNG